MTLVHLELRDDVMHLKSSFRYFETVLSLDFEIYR